MAGRDFSAELFGPSAGRDFSSELFGAKPSKERTFGEAAKDIAAGVVSGAGSLVQLPGQLYGLATGDFSETGALGVGKDIAKYGEEMKSAGLKAREAERAEKIKTAEQKGQWEAFKTAFGETIKDPALLTSFLAEQAPQLLVPFGAAKVAQIGTAAKAAAAAEGLVGKAAENAVKEVTKAAAERGTRAAIGAGAVQQGADVGAQAYEDIYKELIRKGAEPKDAADGAINLARAAGVSGALISLLAQRLPGAKALEETFAGVPGKGGRLLNAAKGALGEGVSEVVEETGGKFGANLAMREVKPEQSLLEGLGQTAGMAAVGGVGMGGVSGLARRPAAKEEAPPAPRTGPLTPEEQTELDRQRAAAERPKTTEELLAGIQTGRPTTPEDITRIRDEHETAVIEGLLAQDVEMKRAADIAAQQREQQKQQLALESEAETIAGGISDIDTRVREGRIFARVQDLIDRNIPYASTAINDINQKFGVINEAPLTEDERARVENIMGMVNTFTNFVNLPVLAPRPVDQFAENQAMEALIKERTERGQAEPLRTTTPAPSPRIEEAPVSQGVGEGAALRPTSGVEPSVAQDRELVTPAPIAPPAAPVTPPAPPVEPVPVVEAAATPAPPVETPAETPAETPESIVPESKTATGQQAGWVLRNKETGEVVMETNDPAKVKALNTDKYEAVPISQYLASLSKTQKPAAPKAEAPAVEAPTPAAEAPQAEPTTLTTQIGGSDTTLDLGKPVWQATDEDLVQAVKDSGAYLGKPGSKYDPYMAWREAHNKAIQQAKRDGKTFPPEVLYDKPKLIRDDLSDSQADEAIDAMVDVYRATKDYGKAVEAYRNFGKKPAAEEPAAPPTLDTTGIKEVKGRHPQVQAAAKLLQDKKMTREEFEKYVDYYKPIQEVEAEKLLPPTSEQKMNETVNADKRDRINVPVEDGTKVGLRMDLPARERGGSVVSIHEGKPGKLTVGKLMGFRSTGWLKDVTFEVRSQEKGLAVATGASKAPQQTVEGTWQNLGPEETYARVKELMKDPAWKQIGFDPSRHGYFYDRKTREPVVSASEMYQVGQFLLAKDVQYAPKTDFLYALGGAKAQQSNFEQTLRTLLNKFGLKDVGLSIIEGMQDAGSYAQRLIRIADRADNPIRTLRHEAIHALRELGFFTDAQWKSLSKMAKDKWIDQYLKQRNVDGKPLKAGEESRYDAYMREYNGDMEKITEEAVADAFADFDATKPPAGMLQALLKRMKDLFQSIKSALTKVESPEQIFGKVEKGELRAGAKAAAKSLRDKATANFLRWFGDSKVVDMIGEPLVVYHGSKSDITEFDPNKGAAGNQGMFFTTDIDLANVYGKDGAVYPVYVSIKNPLILQGNERFAPQGIKGKLAKLLFPAKYTKAEREQRIKDMLFDGNAGRIFSKQDVELLRREGYDGVVTMNAYPEGSNLQVIVAFNPTQIKSAIGNNGDYSLTNADIRKSIGGVSPGQQALETINRMGMGVKPPEPGKFAKLQKILKDAGENPAGTKASAKAALTKWLDWFETISFSGDAAFANKVQRSVIADMKENEEVLGKLLELSQSQAVNADNVVSRGLIEGSIEYNEEMKKWQSVKKDENFAALIGKLEELSKKYGTSAQEMERIAHAYLVAKRLPGIIKRNEELDAEIKAEEATAKPDRKSIDKWKSLKVYVSPEQEAMVDDGISLGKTIPELSQISDMWNAIRKNNIAVMVESGLYTPEYAQQLWDNMDYVPYFREEQLEADAGPTEFIRGLQVKAKEFQLKGSGAAVNDVFENMMLWSQYAMNRAIRADKGRRMIDVAKDIDIGDRKMAEQVKEEKRGMNIVRVFRDGKQELWDMADPMFVPAFAAIQNVSIPMFKWAAKVADVLRNSVVLYPMFSVAQVPQDSFAAMFTSGLKPQHALKIPILAVKEFIKTLNKTSATHNELVKYGVVGARNFSAEVMRQDAEIFAGLKPPKGGWNKTKDFLEHIAMSADNAVRQAVYEAAQQQGVSKQEALEKAFEIFNVRRRGTSKALNLAGQTIPFFYAYLAAQRVAYRTITGVGTSPTERKAALLTLASTSAAVFTLSMLYAMMVADDEDYAETPAAVRDRTLTIPGTGGVRIPLRADFFLFPKMIAEHTYLMLTDKGYEDGAKFRRSMRDGLVNAVASPTPLPQIAKPSLEVAINYSFFDGKPVVGTFEKQKDMERQFNDSTSEFSKLLGQTGLVSPIAADHLIRGMLGSAGGLALYGTNMFLHSDPDVPRPEMSAKEMLAALPGTSGFLKRPQESALKNDFFVLRDEVEKAVNTFNDIKTRSPQGIEDFLADEKQMARLMLGKPVDKINRELSKIRKVITQITNMPESQMSADEKSDNIRQLREVEREMLKSVNVKELREMAKI